MINGSLFRLTCLILLFAAMISAQNLSFERDRHKAMLSLIKNDVKKNYYDPAFKGIDIEAKYKKAAEHLDKSESIGQLNVVIAQFLIEFDDSHLFFLPPGKANKTDYGFDFRMTGDRCFIYHVDKGSDAQKKGLQIGDELFALEGYQPTRENLWKMRYFYFRLRPKGGLNVVAVKPDGRQVQYAIDAKITTGKKVLDLTGNDINQIIRESEDAGRKQSKQYFYEIPKSVFIWKMPSFSLQPDKVDEIIGRAKKSPAIILDLRGNGGGRVDMLLRLIGNVFPQDLKVADEKKRKETNELIAKSRNTDSFTGKIVVLIDSGSASASEVFSRVMQLENRGKVFGDQSAGAVMESRYYGQKLGLDVVVFFGSSITVADLIMKDGKSLEKIGVTPDVRLIPTGKNLAERQDIVMSKALESLGLSVTPEVAGKFFPDNEDNN